MTSDVTLYSYWRSSCSWRVRIALNCKNIDYTYKPIHIVKREQYSDDFITLNPSAQVPLLDIDGIQLAESVAILEYLEETRPKPPLLPKSPEKRAQVRRIVEIVNAGIQPKQNLAVLNYVVDLTSDEGARKKWGNHWVTSGLRAIEKILESTAGTCCVGDEVTFADCALVPQFNSAGRFDVDVSQFPVTKRIVAFLEAKPEFVKAHSSAQPDAVLYVHRVFIWKLLRSVRGVKKSAQENIIARIENFLEMISKMTSSGTSVIPKASLRIQATSPAIIDALLAKHSSVKCNLVPGATYFGVRPEMRNIPCTSHVTEMSSDQEISVGNGPNVLSGAGSDRSVNEKTGSHENEASDVFPDHKLMITAGANQGFMNVVLAVCDSGDEVLLILPYYFSHVNALSIAGVQAICVPGQHRTFLPNVEDVEKRITSQLKAVVVVNPGNPPGIEFPQSLIEQITMLCKENSLWLILDEAYREFCYESGRKTFFTPKLDNFIIKIHTMSKAYGLAGWRVGALLYPKRISEHMRKVQDTIPTHASLVSQAVAFAALQYDPLSTEGPGFIRQLNDVRQILIAALKPVNETAHLAEAFVIPNSAFHFFLPYVLPGKSEPISPEEDMRAVDFLTEKHSVLVCPGFAFGMAGYLRVSYGTVPPHEAQSTAVTLARGLCSTTES